MIMPVVQHLHLITHYRSPHCVACCCELPYLLSVQVDPEQVEVGEPHPGLRAGEAAALGSGCGSRGCACAASSFAAEARGPGRRWRPKGGSGKEAGAVAGWRMRKRKRRKTSARWEGALNDHCGPRRSGVDPEEVGGACPCCERRRRWKA